jgi:hypothetical protein
MGNRKKRKEERRRKKRRRKFLRRAIRTAALLYTEFLSLHFPHGIPDMQGGFGQPFDDAITNKTFRG